MCSNYRSPARDPRPLCRTLWQRYEQRKRRAKTQREARG